jgi:hypothetical protein
MVSSVVRSPDAPKTTPLRIRRAGADIGGQLIACRKIQNLTAQPVAERANISRDTPGKQVRH